MFNFCKWSLSSSLNSLGFKEDLILDLFTATKKINFDSFWQVHGPQLIEVHETHFYQKIVPDFYLKYVTKYIPKSKKVLDIGCGTGILDKELGRSENFENIFGIDLVSYPEWEIFKSSKVKFQIVKEENFSNFLIKLEPDCVILTWALHHMPFKDQETYMKAIYSTIKEDTHVIVLEDSYSENLEPETGFEIYKEFNKLSSKDKLDVMSLLDWISNKVLSRRKDTPVTFTYRTLEEWEVFFTKIGFTVSNKRFIGSPRPKNIDNPQSLFVLKKLKKNI